MMWRALFLALGVYCCILGIESLALDRAILKATPAGENGEMVQREIAPPPWAPWSLMSGGVVVVIYSFTIPKRAQG